MMKKAIMLALTVFVLSPIAKAYSSSEQINYEQIKSAFSKADAELNSVYKQQIQEYKDEGAG